MNPNENQGENPLASAIPRRRRGSEKLDPLVKEARRAARFWTRVDRTGGPSSCWEWTGPIVHNGLPYGQLGHGGMAHRFAWTLLVGKIPEGLLVLHRCDNPPCCNPAHLFLGTQKDNRRDCRDKGRTAKGSANGVQFYLARNPAPTEGKRQKAKITPTQRTEIQYRFAAGGITKAALARDYGLSTAHVCNLINGRSRPPDQSE